MIVFVEDVCVECLMVQEYFGLKVLWGGYYIVIFEVFGFDFVGLLVCLVWVLYDDIYIDVNLWVGKGCEFFEEVVLKGFDDVNVFDCLVCMFVIDFGKMCFEFLVDC